MIAAGILSGCVDAELSAFMLKARTLRACVHDSLRAGHSLPVAAAVLNGWLLACGLAGSACLCGIHQPVQRTAPLLRADLQRRTLSWTRRRYRSAHRPCGSSCNRPWLACSASAGECQAGPADAGRPQGRGPPSSSSRWRRRRGSRTCRGRGPNGDGSGRWAGGGRAGGGRGGGRGDSLCQAAGTVQGEAAIMWSRAGLRCSAGLASLPRANSWLPWPSHPHHLCVAAPTPADHPEQRSPLCLSINTTCPVCPAPSACRPSSTATCLSSWSASSWRATTPPTCRS